MITLKKNKNFQQSYKINKHIYGTYKIITYFTKDTSPLFQV